MRLSLGGILPLLLSLGGLDHQLPHDSSRMSSIQPHYSPTWADLSAAMRLYHTAHGDLCMQLGWQVPDAEPWPASLWGMKLAKVIYRREFWKEFIADNSSRRAELDELGFVWSRLQPEYNLVLEALMTYQELHGDLLVPASFVVPSQPPWPRGCWTMRLGSRVASIRTRNDHIRTNPQRWFQLEAMGFAFQVSEVAWTRFVSALETYKRLHGNLRVPTGFVVPHDNHSAWPVNLHGFRLGETVNNVRTKRLYLSDNPARDRELAELGFVWEVSADRFELIMTALAVFKSLHGHVDVKQQFIVPAESPWPEECYGLPLGRRVAMIRTRGDMVKASSERRARLSSIGLRWHVPRGPRRSRDAKS